MRKPSLLIDTQTWRDSRTGKFYWFEFPHGTDPRDSFATATHHGPFKSDAEAVGHARITLLGPDCKVTECGAWDPAWDRAQ